MSTDLNQIWTTYLHYDFSGNIQGCCKYPFYSIMIVHQAVKKQQQRVKCDLLVIFGMISVAALLKN